MHVHPTLATLAFLLPWGAPVPEVVVPRFVSPDAVPAERLIATLEARLKATPDDHHVLYSLARVHYLVLVNECALVPAFGSGSDAMPAMRRWDEASIVFQLQWDQAGQRARESMQIAADAKLDAAQLVRFDGLRNDILSQLEREKWMPPPPAEPVLLEHARKAAVLFDRAIELGPGHALYHLGRASFGEQVLDLVAGKKLSQAPPGITADVVAERYFETFKLAVAGDLKRPHIPIEGLEGIISHEAGTAWLRLTEARAAKDGAPAPTDVDATRTAVVRRLLARVEKLPGGPITPIVVGSHARRHLPDLLDARREVVFDLDGDGAAERWPWVRPDTGILVWAPGGDRTIASGRQLFGSVTFGLFHRDGYAALALLDCDQDGELRALELDGIGIWYDRDGDGTADPGEVVSAFAAGVEAIGAIPDGVEPGTQGSSGNAPRCSRGLRYRDGEIVPTIDWIAERRS